MQQPRQSKSSPRRRQWLGAAQGHYAGAQRRGGRAGADAVRYLADAGSWYALLVPKATPQPAVDTLGADVRALLATPAVRAELQRQGMEPVGSTPQALDARIREETASWAKLIRAYGITAE